MKTNRDTEEIKKWVKAQKLAIFEQATKLADSFWANRNDLLEERIGGEDAKTGNVPKLGCSVRMAKDGSVRIVWHKYHFYSYTGVVDGSLKKIRKRNNVYLTRPKKGYGYNIDKLKKYALRDEHRVLEIVESKFEELRYKLAILSKINASLLSYDVAEIKIRKKHEKNKQTAQKQHDESPNNEADMSEENESIDFDKFGEDDD